MDSTCTTDVLGDPAVWIACVIVKLTPFMTLVYLDVETHMAIFADYELMAVITGSALLISFSQYFLLGYDEDAMAGEDFAGRLRRAIEAGQDLLEGRHSQIGPISQRFVLYSGLGDRFTKRELDQARCRLASELHPDRWSNLPEHARQTREEMLKQVNAAYERLRPMAC